MQNLSILIFFLDLHNNSVLISRYKNCDEKAILPTFPFKITYNEAFLHLFTAPTRDFDSSSWDIWLKNVFLTKFLKIIKNYETIGHKTPTKSLKLIENTEFYRLYGELKRKYGTSLIESWTECTDPQKYVFEDLAIATYLLLLWQKYSEGEQNFYDLGCGNGLLVYILASEGHRGTGIDIRKRKIWDVYPKNEKMILKEQTITPSDIFPDADWIIGNHSDELSPWIPVMAAKSSYKTKFLLLPCCAYEFNGQKYRRTNSNKSVYEEFIEYATKISQISGFEIEIDRLTIPSTKRIAVIGIGRIYDEIDTEKYSNSIDKFIQNRMSDAQPFKPRDSVEVVKNCTKIDKEIAFKIVYKVFNELLSKKRYVPEFPEWSVGGTLALKSVIELLSDSERKILKENAGGLQTLLKNHHNVFQVTSGQVSIRIPVKYEKERDFSKEKHFKKADCWFLKYHPKGCPLDESECSYRHFSNSESCVVTNKTSNT